MVIIEQSVSDSNNLKINDVMSQIERKSSDDYDRALKYLKFWIDNPEDCGFDDGFNYDFTDASWGTSSDHIVRVLKNFYNTGYLSDD